MRLSAAEYTDCSYSKRIFLEKSYYSSAQARYSFYVYIPISTSDPSKFVRAWYSTRLNSAQTGSLRLGGFAWGHLRPTLSTLLGAGAPRTGVWAAYPTPSAIGDNSAVYTLGTNGETAPYTVNVSQGGVIAWSYVEAPNGGNVRVVVSLNGTLISTVDLDTYHVGSSPYVYSRKTVILNENLAAGSYVVTITALNTKNALSSGYRVYDLGVDSADSIGTGGTTGLWVPSNSSDLHTSGNFEYASFVRPSGSVNPADFVYCWGTHGNEQAVSAYSLSLDSVDYATILGNTANMQGTRWAGISLTLDYTVPLQWGGGIKWCDHRTISQITVSGINVAITRTTTLAARIRQEYIGMLILSDADSGGFTEFTFLSSPRQVVSVPPTPAMQNSVSALEDSYGCICSDGSRTVSVSVYNPGDLNALYARDVNSQKLGLATLQPTGYFKVYSAAIFQANTESADILIPEGNILSARFVYRFR